MTKEQFLAEQLGECIPEWKEISEWDGVERDYFNVCIKCDLGEYYHSLRTPFQNADEANKFFILWNWAIKQEWWFRFMYLDEDGDLREPSMEFYINYENLSNAIYEYLSNKDDN